MNQGEGAERCVMPRQPARGYFSIAFLRGNSHWKLTLETHTERKNLKQLKTAALPYANGLATSGGPRPLCRFSETMFMFT